MCKILYIQIVLLAFSNPSFAQIRLSNPSFEGDHQDATVPQGWFPCNDGTTPDILPGPWAVYQSPSDGNSYMGLITREDGSYESVGQRLMIPLKPNECYSMAIDLAHSPTYASYNEIVIFRIWGGTDRCEMTQLLGKTSLVAHTDWRTYIFHFFPTKNINYIMFEAYFPNSSNKVQRGNVLMDNCSPIKVCIRA